VRRTVIVSAIVTLMTGSARVALAQDERVALAQDEWKMLAGFRMTVAHTSKGVSLTCEKGCAWKTLEFPFAAKATAVNESGMVNDKGNPERSGNFLIRFGTEPRGFLLSCDRGCAWRTLGWGFPANGVAVPINEYGMAKRK